MHARNSFKNKMFWKDYKKALKKLTLIFLSNPVPFNGKSYQKQKEPGTGDQSLFKLQNKFRKITLSVIYFLTKFLSYSKYYICKFMQANSWHHKLFHFHLSFWIWKVWKGKEKITKIWISWGWKELFRWNIKRFS